MAGIAALRKLQTAKESAAGTALPCTAVIAGVDGYKPKVGDQKIVQPSDEHGSLAKSSRSYTPMTQFQAGWDGRATFEDILYWLGMAVKAAGAASVYDVTAFQTTVTPSMTAANTPDTRTMKFGDDGQALYSTLCFLTGLEFSATHDEAWKFNAQMVGQGIFTTTFNALSDRTAEEVLGAKTALYMDSTGGTIGSTQKTLTLLDWSWKLGPHFVPKRRQDNQLTLVGYNELKMQPTLEMTVELTAGIEALRVLYQAETRQLVRLKALGSLIAGTSSATKKTMIIDGAYKITDFDTLDEKDGATVVKMSLTGDYDATYAKLFELSVINGSSVVP